MPEREVDAIVAAECGSALREIDARLYEAGRGTLEVNRPGRVIPHYPFHTSADPKAWGVENYNTQKIHPKVGKSTGSKRK
jgi:hypothetical protein